MYQSNKYPIKVKKGMNNEKFHCSHSRGFHDFKKRVIS